MNFDETVLNSLQTVFNNTAEEYCIQFEHKIEGFKDESYINFLRVNVNGFTSDFDFKKQLQIKSRAAYKEIAKYLCKIDISSRTKFLEQVLDNLEELRNWLIEEKYIINKSEFSSYQEYKFIAFVDNKFQGSMEITNNSLRLRLQFKTKDFVIAWREVVEEAKATIHQLLNQTELIPFTRIESKISELPFEISNMHPIVIKAAGHLYSNGHFRQAILDTYIALVEAVRTQSGLDLDNTPLMQAAFSQKSPRIKVSNDGDEQLGFMWLYAGAVMGIRNPKAHKLIEQNDPVRTVEWLSFASVLFRILDDAK
jgi:uncharacterized protein (TIGR02391 family)